MDIDNNTVSGRFQQALIRFAAGLTTKDKAKALLASIDNISFMGTSVSVDHHTPPST